MGNLKPKKNIASMGLKDLRSSSNILLTAESKRKQEALKKFLANKGKKMLTQDQISSFLVRWMDRLYDRVKIDGALTQDKVADYLSMFVAVSIPALGVIYGSKEKKIIETFEDDSKMIVKKMADDGELEQKDIIKCIKNISHKSKQLFNKPLKDKVKIVEDIGVDLTITHEKSQKNSQVTKRVTGFDENIIPMGFQKDAPKMSVLEFLKFPIGKRNKNDKSWFEQHLKYLKLAIGKKVLSKVDFKKIKSLLPYAPKIRYKKYIDVFGRNEFEEARFMAVYSLWQNNALIHLRGNLEQDQENPRVFELINK